MADNKVSRRSLPAARLCYKDARVSATKSMNGFASIFRGESRLILLRHLHDSMNPVLQTCQTCCGNLPFFDITSCHSGGCLTLSKLFGSA